MTYLETGANTIKEDNMENENRPLMAYEKILIILSILLIFAAVPFFLLEINDIIDYANPIGWICISVANILRACVRWDTRAKENISSIRWWLVLFVISIISLIIDLVI